MKNTEDKSKYTNHDLELAAAAEKMQSAIWEAIKSNVPKCHSNNNQLGCCVIALAGVLDGVAKIMTSGYGETHTVKDVLQIILDMDEASKKKDESDA